MTTTVGMGAQAYRRTGPAVAAALLAVALGVGVSARAGAQQPPQRPARPSTARPAAPVAAAQPAAPPATPQQTPTAPPAQTAAAVPQDGAVPLQLAVPPAARLVAITNATVLTASHGTIEHGTILIRDGRIAEVGTNVQVPAGAQVIDGTGKFVMPGIIDSHSHTALEAVNEGTNSVTSEVRVEDVLREDGGAIFRELAGGVTSIQVYHGSANTIGGQSSLLKLRYGLPVDSLFFQGAPPP